MTPREKLERLAGRLPAGCAWLGLPSDHIAEIAGRAGARVAVIDCEHGAIGVESMTAMLRALALTRTGALVRVPELAEGPIKHALDAGADGILVPYVESVEEARRAVRAALLPPEGARGLAGIVRAAGYGAEAAAYERDWNARALVALQIESRRGLSAAIDIAAVPGVDMLFLGPFDYCRDAGLDPAADGDLLQAVLAETVAAAHAHGKLAGVFPWPGAEPRALAAAGADLVALAHDTATLMAGLRAALGALDSDGRG
ncbi:MAG: aldolase/citrate lyase family protein [Pseudomonadota bacterium]